jgi:hypothetical protein
MEVGCVGVWLSRVRVLGRAQGLIPAVAAACERVELGLFGSRCGRILLKVL